MTVELIKMGKGGLHWKDFFWKTFCKWADWFPWFSTKPREIQSSGFFPCFPLIVSPIVVPHFPEENTEVSSGEVSCPRLYVKTGGARIWTEASASRFNNCRVGFSLVNRLKYPEAKSESNLHSLGLRWTRTAHRPAGSPWLVCVSFFCTHLFRSSVELSGNNGPPDNVLSKAALKETGETLCLKKRLLQCWLLTNSPKGQVAQNCVTFIVMPLLRLCPFYYVIHKNIYWHLLCARHCSWCWGYRS